MSQDRIAEVVAARLAPYLPPGATEAECTIPAAEIADWLGDEGAPPLPPDARDPAWWSALAERRDYPALPDAAWRVERIDWEGAGITFSYADSRDDTPGTGGAVPG
jgi:hypothetical protein